MRLPARVELAPAVHRTREPRRHLRIERIELRHGIGEERVAAAIRRVEMHGVEMAEAADDGAGAVRIPDVEVGVLHERTDARGRVRQA